MFVMLSHLVGEDYLIFINNNQQPLKPATWVMNEKMLHDVANMGVVEDCQLPCDDRTR